MVNVVDIALGIFILILGLRGLLRGLIKEVFGLLALIGGVIISDIFGKKFGAIICHYLTITPSLGYALAFFIVFLIVYLILLILGYILSSIIRAIQLGWLDRTLGFAFGALKATLLIAVLAFILENFTVFNYLNKDLKKSSLIYSTVSQYLNEIDIQQFINRAKHIKDKKLKGLTIIIGGYSEKG